MPNYSLVIDAKFKPFSYDELIKPALMQTQAHQAIEEEYGELATKASIWENMANEQTDPYAYKMYKTYANDLETKAEQLMRQGLNPSSRKDMLNMKARYSKEITPIENAYTARQKQAEEQQKALLQDPTLMLSRRASITSLDDYIKNPQLSYESYSGKLITAQAANAASALAKEMRDNPRKWRDILGYSYYETMMQKGFSSQAVLQAIQDHPEAAQQLTRIVDDAVNSSGVKDWGDEATILRAIDYAKQGLWNAVGETQYQTLDNWRAKMNAQEALRQRAAQEQQLRGLAINPLSIYSSRELSESEQEYRNRMNKFSKYFYRENGQWKMNREGWKEYNRNTGESRKLGALGVSGSTISSQVRGENPDHTEFRRFMDSLGMSGMSSESFGPWQGSQAGSLWGNYADYSPESKTAKYDASKVTEYDYAIASSRQDDMKDAILTAARGQGLREVDYDSKSKTFKDTGNILPLNKLVDSGYKVTSTRMSPYGTTVMIQDSKGDVKRYMLPTGINQTNEDNRDNAMASAHIWQQVINTGQYTDAQGNIHRATPDEITYAQQQYAQAVQQAYMYQSQLGLSNKTEEQEFHPYGY